MLMGLSLCVGSRAADLPEGRSILRNGDFCEDAEHPVGWVTRDSGNLGRFSLLPPEAGSKSRVLSCEVTQTSAQPWTMELRQALTLALAKGETLYVAFEYKITAGYAFNCYWQQDSDPWPKFLSVRLDDPVDQWHKCTMKVTVPEHLQPRSTSISFHLAEKTGTLKLRDLEIRAFPAHIATDLIPTNTAPAIGGDYNDNTWRDDALARLKKVRTAPLKVLVRRGGQPVEGAVVTARQRSRGFSFGVTLLLPLLDETVLQLPDSEALRERLQGTTEKLGKYRETVLDKTLFDTVSLADALTWKAAVAWGNAAAPAAIDGLIGLGFQVRGNALYCPSFRFAPPEARTLGKDALKQAFENFVHTQVATYKGKVVEWDVLQAPLTYEEIYGVIGEDSLVNAFKIAEQEDPAAMLVCNADQALTDTSDERVQELIEFVKWLRSGGARVDAVGLEAELKPPFVAPQAIEQRLAKIAEGTGLPIVITSLSVDAPKEDIQASTLKDLLTAFYANPAVRRVVFSEVWDAATPFGRTGLFRRNFAIKPAGQMLRTLLTQEWCTNETAKTDAQGTAAITGFQGAYEVTVELDGKQVKKEVTLADATGAALTLDLPE
ncbi:MAG: hypothetical protein A3K19_28135 [Lentisphaerae bacterium RIFOXYB12_FULL_65_16]|nr:MAG: hypothetical protein A3K18_34305 [Lentisphaerae bacterium RIFOXYA12_64_32]OGV85461.1 MAG: hypothetical protein A3K19_28135 [Lentisphaerae bacterium RIFOXYB12_FULL_65_16]